MGDHAPVPVAKDKLLEALAARQEPASIQPKPSNAAVLEGRKHFNLAVEDEILDYLHNHPTVIESCLKTLIKIFGNILQHPEDEKYRSIKASSNTLRGTVCNVKGGEHLLVLAGWTTQVVELQKHWVFDAAPGSTKFGILFEAHAILEHALDTIHLKTERQTGTVAGRRVGDEAARKAILLQIEDDKISRKVKAETTALVTPVKASSLPGEKPHTTGVQDE